MNILKWNGLDIDPSKISESITTKPAIGRIDTAFSESTNESGITCLYPQIEAIHAGRTRNFNRYEAHKLKGDPELRSGVYSWTHPYPKPVIFNHDISTECTGRVYSASYSDITSAGRPGIIVTPKITNEKTIKEIMDGRLLTVSIGASTNAAVCSCCGTDILNEGFCGHMRGESYDGQVCEWICGDLFFDELSWVNVPADSDAMVISNGTNNLMTTQTESNNGLTTEKVVVKKVENTKTTDKEDSVVEDNKVIDNVVEEAEVVETTEVEESTEVTVEEETETVEQVEEATEEVEESVEELRSQIEQLLEEKLALETKESETSKALKEKEEDLGEAKASLEEAQQKLVDAEKTVEALTDANEKLHKELHDSVVEFLVDLRVAVGKESSKEEAITKFGSRSIESLKDSISDILAEKPTISTGRTVEKIERPTGKVVTESFSQKVQESTVVKSDEEALLKLLSGRR